MEKIFDYVNKYGNYDFYEKALGGTWYAYIFSSFLPWLIKL